MLITAADMKGGCSCGAVRYRLASEPFDTGWCHCRTCQRISGAPAMVFTTVNVEDFVIERGQHAIGTTRPTEFGVRRFCTRCGTPLTIAVDFQPDTIDIAAATLDQPDKVEPGFRYADRIDWAEAGAPLPRHDKWRPGTRGL